MLSAFGKRQRLHVNVFPVVYVLRVSAYSACRKRFALERAHLSKHSSYSLLRRAVMLAVNAEESGERLTANKRLTKANRALQMIYDCHVLIKKSKSFKNGLNQN